MGNLSKYKLLCILPPCLSNTLNLDNSRTNFLDKVFTYDFLSF